jgi:hypothetical protein
MNGRIIVFGIPRVHPSRPALRRAVFAAAFLLANAFICWTIVGRAF